VAKLKLDDLVKLRDEARTMVALREGKGRAKVTVHMGTCGIASGARDIMDAFLKEIETRRVTDVILSTSGCAGLCSREPMATVEITGQAPVKYADLTPEKAKRIFEEHVMGGRICTDLALAFGSERAF
jgi:NADP-reducing hydrogenase subunit HndB